MIIFFKWHLNHMTKAFGIKINTVRNFQHFYYLYAQWFCSTKKRIKLCKAYRFPMHHTRWSHRKQFYLVFTSAWGLDAIENPHALSHHYTLMRPFQIFDRTGCLQFSSTFFVWTFRTSLGFDTSTCRHNPQAIKGIARTCPACHDWLNEIPRLETRMYG